MSYTPTATAGQTTATADGVAGSSVVVRATGSWNGATVDRLRGNTDSSGLIASTGTTTTQQSADQINYNGRGCNVVLDMTNVGTGSVTLSVQGKDPVSGKYYTILTGVAVTTNSTNVYTIYPGQTVVANVAVSAALPRTWRVLVTANNANPVTYTVNASVIL